MVVAGAVGALLAALLLGMLPRRLAGTAAGASLPPMAAALGLSAPTAAWVRPLLLAAAAAALAAAHPALMQPT